MTTPTPPRRKATCLVHIRLTPAQKARWQAAATDVDWTMTDLITHCVDGTLALSAARRPDPQAGQYADNAPHLPFSRSRDAEVAATVRAASRSIEASQKTADALRAALLPPRRGR